MQATATAKQPSTRLMSLDGRDFSREALGQMRKALKQFGLFVYLHPGCEGSDTYVVIISADKLTRAQQAACGPAWMEE